MFENIKKKLLIASIICVSVLVLLLMAALIATWGWKYSLFSKTVYTDFVLTFLILSLDCFFTYNSLTIYKREKTLAKIAIVLLNLSTLLGLICVWVLSEIETDGTFGKVTLCLAISASFFTIVLNTYAKLKGNLKALQAVYYILMICIDLTICLLINGISLFTSINWYIYLFILMCLAALALMIISNIIGKHYVDVDNKKIGENTKEHEELIDKYRNLQIENELLKEKLAKYQEKYGDIDEK